MELATALRIDRDSLSHAQILAVRAVEAAGHPLPVLARALGFSSRSMLDQVLRGPAGGCLLFGPVALVRLVALARGCGDDAIPRLAGAAPAAPPPVDGCVLEEVRALVEGAGLGSAGFRAGDLASLYDARARAREAEAAARGLAAECDAAISAVHEAQSARRLRGPRPAPARPLTVA